MKNIGCYIETNKINRNELFYPETEADTLKEHGMTPGNAIANSVYTSPVYNEKPYHQETYQRTSRTYFSSSSLEQSDLGAVLLIKPRIL
jgi:hypothetical protein